MPTELPAAAAGSMTLGGDLVVRRMGFGAMRLTGQGIWGAPPTGPVRTRCSGAPWSSGSTSSTPRIRTAPT